jgi:hypothetical protein
MAETDRWDVVAMADLLSRDGYGGAYARPTSYDVSVWPPGTGCMDSETWKLISPGFGCEGEPR